MQLTALLPHLAGLRLITVILESDDLILEVAVRAVSARCPCCGRRSGRVHSAYVRRITDEPVGGRVRLHVRRFRCMAPTCARRSRRLQTLLEDVGLTLGGRPGARFARRRGVRVSRTPLLRQVRRLPLPDAETRAVLGIDDFALRRGHRYGTVLVDLQGRRIVDVLPTRTSEVVESWLAQRTAPEVVCRDRSGAYAEAAQRAVPTATQISDRFHPTFNASTVLERVLARHAVALRAATTDDGALLAAAEPLRESHEAASAPAPPRTRRQLCYDAVRELHQQG